MNTVLIAVGIVFAVALACILVLLVWYAIRSLGLEEQAEYRGCTLQQMRDMPNDKLVMLALSHLVMLADCDQDLGDELAFRATGKRLAETDKETPQ